MTVPSRYGGDRVRSAIIYFLFGKGLTSVAGLVFLLLLVRGLPVTEFAAYSILLAFVEVITAVSGFGFTHAVLRYVPELYSQHEMLVLRKFVAWTLSLRIILLSLAIIAAYYFASYLAGWFGLDEWISVLQLFLVVVWLRVNNHFLFQILESTLHQGRGQLAFILLTWLKLIFVAALISTENINIINVIWAELFAEMIGLSVFVVSVGRVIMENQEDVRLAYFSDWWRENARRVTYHGFAGYVQHLAILPYGSAPNRLVAGRFLEATTTAAFGFAQSCVDLIRRYLPAQLLAGTVRPVLVARFSASGNFAEVSDVLTFLFRINTMLLGFIAVSLLAAGEDILGFITDGKYHSEAATLLLGFVVVLILESRRFALDLMVQTAERYRLLVTANVMLALSLVLSIGLLPFLGVKAIPLAAGIGLLCSNAWVALQLKKEGFSCSIGYVDIVRIAISVAASAAVGLGIKSQWPWQLGFFMACLMYPILLLVTGALRREDWMYINKIRRGNIAASGG